LIERRVDPWRSRWDRMLDIIPSIASTTLTLPLLY
jgi:hypothetical protein